MAGANGEVVACVVECSTSELLSFVECHLVDANYFKILNIDELEVPLGVSDNANSRPGFESSCKHKLDWAEGVGREVHNLIYGRRCVQLYISFGGPTVGQEHLLVLTVEFEELDGFHHIRDPAHKFDHHLLLKVDVVDVTF